jgi:hypothetical protein
VDVKSVITLTELFTFDTAEAICEAADENAVEFILPESLDCAEATMVCTTEELVRSRVVFAFAAINNFSVKAAKACVLAVLELAPADCAAEDIALIVA